jgi:hypothetical protein
MTPLTQYPHVPQPIPLTPVYTVPVADPFNPALLTPQIRKPPTPNTAQPNPLPKSMIRILHLSFVVMPVTLAPPFTHSLFGPPIPTPLNRTSKIPDHSFTLKILRIPDPSRKSRARPEVDPPCPMPALAVGRGQRTCNPSSHPAWPSSVDAWLTLWAEIDLNSPQIQGPAAAGTERQATERAPVLLRATAATGIRARARKD